MSETLTNCALYTTCALMKIYPDPPKKPLFFLLFAGELSTATESVRQEMGVHFYASRSTSEVGFYMNFAHVEQA